MFTPICYACPSLCQRGGGGGGGLWVCFSCTLLSLEVGMGPKQNDSEKSSSTLKICIKISGKPKRPGSL